MRSSGSLADVIHRLSLPTHALGEVQDLLHEVVSLRSQDDAAFSRGSLKDVVGLLLEVYRSVFRLFLAMGIHVKGY